MRQRNKYNNSAIATHLGDSVHSLRVRKGWTLDEVSRGANVSQGTLSAIENGRQAPSAQTLWRLSNWFGVTVDQWFEGYSEDASSH